MPLTLEQQQSLGTLRNRLQGNLKLNVHNASQHDPDQYAQSLKLATDAGLPVDLTQRNTQEVERRERVKTVDVDRLDQNNPYLKEYLNKKNNAAVSLDDTDNLMGIEDTLKRPARGFINNVSRGAGDRAVTLAGNFLEFLGNVSNSFEEQMVELGLPNPGFVFGEDGVSWSWDIDPAITNPEIIGKRISEARPFDYQPNFTWEKFKGDLTPGNLAGFVLEQGIQSLPDMAAAYYVLPAYIASRTEEIAEERVSNDKRESVEFGDLEAAFLPAVAVSLVERLGAKFIFNAARSTTIRQAAKAIGAGAAVEGGTEFIQEGVEFLGETLGTKKAATTENLELINEMLDRQLAGLVAGGGFGGSIKTVTEVTNLALNKKIAANIEQAVKTQEEQAVIDTLVGYAQTNRTRERAPENFQEFISGIPADNVLIAQDVINNIEGLPDFPMPITGEDIEISMADFLTHIAPNEEILAAVRPHIRLSYETKSQSEMVETDAQSLINKALAEQDKLTESETIFKEVRNQIVDTGRQSAAAAKFSARIIPSYVASKAEQLGKTVKEVYQMMGLKIIGPKDTVPGPRYAQKQSITVAPTEERTITETGEKVTVQKNIQKQWDQTYKRRNMGQKLMDCL